MAPKDSNSKAELDYIQVKLVPVQVGDKIGVQLRKLELELGVGEDWILEARISNAPNQSGSEVPTYSQG